MPDNVRLITPEVEVIDTYKFGGELPAQKMIECVGRACYNSYDKITDTSYIKFNMSAAKKGHRSIFEFNNIQFVFNSMNDVEYRTALTQLSMNKYLHVRNYVSYDGGNIIIEGSIRAFIELLEEMCLGGISHVLFSTIFYEFDDTYSFFPAWTTYDKLLKHAEAGPLSSTTYKFNDITNDSGERNDKFKKVLVRLRIDRGLHNELVRHRPVSHMAESQRYVRYGNNDNPFEICVATNDFHNNHRYCGVLTEHAEKSLIEYKELLATCSPQYARAVLPMCTAITHFMYATITEWEHIFRMRASHNALPMAQEVAKEIWNQMINKDII